MEKVRGKGEQREATEPQGEAQGKVRPHLGGE